MIKRMFEEKIPVAPLKIVAMQGMEEIAVKIDKVIIEERKRQKIPKSSLLYQLRKEPSSYLVKYTCPRFETGESKAILKQSVRGSDVFILTDISNYSKKYRIHNEYHHMSADDHFQDLKRIISACDGHPHRINVIMPFLYEGRQDNKKVYESLDCAVALQELTKMGVENIITFDAHDARVQNAIPLNGFDDFFARLQMMQSLFQTQPDLIIDKQHFMTITPDEGGMNRAIYYANVLGVNMGMFYKRRDYSVVIDNTHPVVSYEFLGNSVKDIDVFVVDDMIVSGESMLEVAKELKYRNAKHVFLSATFGLFTEGLEKFDIAYKNKLFDQIYTTNLCYTTADLLKRPYYTQVDLSKYIGLIIDNLNHDTSVNNFINPTQKIQELLSQYQNS